MKAFTEETTSDQKRLARGEQLKHARSLLRARDWKHSGPWRVMMVSGRYPLGEIVAIQELMPHAKILAVDKDREAVRAAADCGVDSIRIDLSEFTWYGNGSHTRSAARPHPEILAWLGKDGDSQIKFDLIHLDLCGTVMGHAYDIIPVYHNYALAVRGVMIADTSYGREVREVIFADYYRGRRVRRSYYEPSEGVVEDPWDTFSVDVPEEVRARVEFLFPGHRLPFVRSIITYCGHHQPMLSVLASKTPWKRSYVHLGSADLQAAIICEQLNLQRLYDTPEERVMAFRRSFAAIKAVSTRRAKQVDNFKAETTTQPTNNQQTNER
jgi:hypothetical protein